MLVAGSSCLLVKLLQQSATRAGSCRRMEALIGGCQDSMQRRALKGLKIQDLLALHDACHTLRTLVLGAGQDVWQASARLTFPADHPARAIADVPAYLLRLRWRARSVGTGNMALSTTATEGALSHSTALLATAVQPALRVTLLQVRALLASGQMAQAQLLMVQCLCRCPRCTLWLPGPYLSDPIDILHTGSGTRWCACHLQTAPEVPAAAQQPTQLLYLTSTHICSC